MASNRHTSISRKRLVSSESPSQPRYRSKTPQPPAPPKSSTTSCKKKKILQYRARTDSGSQQQIEEELPDYVRATTPQPHSFNNNSRITIQRSNSSSGHCSGPSPIANADNSMFTFVKTEFEPSMAMATAGCTAAPTPLPMIHNQLPPVPHSCSHNLAFNTNKIHQIPKPQSVRPRTDSTQSNASMTPEFGALLSPKQMEAQILSHYDESALPMKPKLSFLSKIKETKAKKSKKEKKRKSKPFNDEDIACAVPPPFGAPKSTPPQTSSGHWKTIAPITPCYAGPVVVDEFMEDSEVAAKSFAYDQSLRQPQMRMQPEIDIEDESEREMDKIRFKCDQLDWNLNTLQSNTDKDIRQITAKIHRVEHDIKTQNELFNGYHTGRHNNINNGRRSSIFNSLQSSIGAVMRNVESIKDALQTLDLRMSIINQRQHDIFKHIDETKDILDTNTNNNNNNNSNSMPCNVPLVLNARDNTALLSSRRASLQSMSEMLRLQCTQSMSISNSNSNSHSNEENPLILPTYDDNEDILHPQSVTKKKLLGHIRPELLIHHNAKAKINNAPCMISQRAQTKKDESHDYGIAIERTLPRIVEQDDDSNDSNDDEERVSLSRRKHHKHVRSSIHSIHSGLSDNIISQIKCETMLIHSSSESDDCACDDEKAIEYNKHHNDNQDITMDEEKQYGATLNKQKRKYSESYSLNIDALHVKNTLTQTQNIDKRVRTGSMSYDIGREGDVTYEREISRNDMDPLELAMGLKDRTALSPVHDNITNDDDDEDSVSDLSVDSMSDLSADANVEEEEEGKKKKKRKKGKEKEEKRIMHTQLMNTKFILYVVPHRFTIINDYIQHRWTDKASYLLTICNNTTSHDLFFKTSKIYSCKSNKSLICFRQCKPQQEEDEDDTIVIDNSAYDDNSDDHLAPMEQMTFGDVNIKKGIRYAGYFVYEAYPFPNTGNDSDGDRSRQVSTLITPNYKHNPITPHLKPHAVLNAIDEKHKYDAPDLQFTELRLGSMSPSTVNKYRRQSLSTSSRRTSVRRMSTEPSVTSLLDRALDEEHNNANYPWNDGLDDLVDIVIGFDIQLSVGDSELNSFKCYIQFSEYSQPTHYHTELAQRRLLKSFCNGGSDGLHMSHNELVAQMNITNKHSIHPQIVANIAYSGDSATNQQPVTILKEPETFDID